MNPYSPIIRPPQSPQSFPGPSNAPYQQFRDQISTAIGPIRTRNNQDVRAERPHGLTVQQAMRMSLLVSDPTTPTVRPATPIEANEVPGRGQSHSVTQPHSPAMQGNGVPQQVLLESNVLSNIGLQPVQSNTHHLQPQFSSQNSFQPLMNNNNNGQQQRSFSMSTLTPSFDPAMQYGPAFVTPQQMQLGHLDPAAFGSIALHNPALVPSADLDALANSQDCACGPDCNCTMCGVHPYNAATLGFVHELGQVMVRDDYGEGSSHANPHVSQPLPGTGGALINSTITEPVMGQELLPLPGTGGALIKSKFAEPVMGQELLPLSDDFSPWVNVSTEDPAPQPTYEEGEAVNNGEQPNQFFTIGYKVRYTGGSERCECDGNCSCFECLHYRGEIFPL